MLKEMHWYNWYKWKAYFESDPWDGSRMDMGFAIVAKMVHELYRATVGPRKVEEIDFEEFMPKFGENKHEFVQEDSIVQQIKMMKFTAAMGGTITYAGNR